MTKYGIVIKRIPITSAGKEKSLIEIGTLLNLKPPQGESDRVIRFTIKEYCQNDTNEQNSIFNQVHECHSHYVMQVEERVWPYIISITMSERVNFLKDNELIKFVLNLQENDPVSVDGKYFQQNTSYDCVVRYIGLVPEMSKGLYFGLEILNPEFYDFSPQTPDIPFANIYCKTEAENCFIVPANFLLKSDEGFTIVENKKSSMKRMVDKIKPKSKNTPPEPTLNVFSDEYSEGLLNYENKLEQRQKDSSKTGTKSKKSKGLKPSFMLYDDKQIVVIDKNDIKESTKGADEVIIVDKKKKNDLDLADLLGKNWPANGGEPCEMLNSEPGNVNVASLIKSSKNERNKSANFISHIGKKYKNDENSSNMNSQLTKLDYATGGARTGDIKEHDKMKTINYTNVSYSNNRFELLTTEPEPIHYSHSLKEIEGTNLGIGSVVQIHHSEKLYGVIKWIGTDITRQNTMVGVELEEAVEANNLLLTDGILNGKRYFKCQEKRAVFVDPSNCYPDERFNEVVRPNKKHNNDRGFEKEVDPSRMFGHVDCPIIKGSVVPLTYFDFDELEVICGEFKGIQGHHNSCYLDATLFAMFTFTSVFDSLLFRPAGQGDIESYEEVQTVLREEIVNPLRENIFVRADRVMRLRQLLEKLSSVTGLTSEEKDPEEFLNSLLAQIMKAEPFLKLNSGQDAFFYQLFIEKDERIKFPSVQELFEQSFLSSDIKLKEVPSCLIIQMPRFGKNYKMYPRILPSQVLDVTDIIEDSPRQCSMCGRLATYECRDCFRSLPSGGGLEDTAFCHKCLKTCHSHVKRQNHNPKELSIPEDVKQLGDEMVPPRIFMELFAVVCIETSHYVSFVKAGPGLDAPWCFFDSMADRKGEQNGYNIPKLTSVPDLPKWLSEDGAKQLNEAAVTDKLLPEHAKRLLCDAYMCMYQSPDVMMYQ